MFRAYKTRQLILTFLITIFSAPITRPSYALASEWGPWDKDKVYVKQEGDLLKTHQDNNLLRTIAVFPGLMLISFFQTVISPVDGASCDFYPTCSAYAAQALKKHGLFIGLTMASERLCRYHSSEGYEAIVKYGSYYSYDPVENNDFWFNKKSKACPP
jgi:putative membrane protein insertion efficiency factor